MCGIVGLCDRMEPNQARRLLRRLLATMEARGPDGSGEFVEDQIVMGMRRLAVIDVEGGGQPLLSRDGQVIAFQNGEIYNSRLQHPRTLGRKTELEYKLTMATILVGHSLGGSFILNVLERYQVGATFLVAPVYGILGNDFDEGMKTFAQRTFDWPTILANCPHFEIFHSDNDPYIPLAKAQELSQHLNTSVTLVPGAGHFNTSAGYTEFPELLKQLTQN